MTKRIIGKQKRTKTKIKETETVEYHTRGCGIDPIRSDLLCIVAKLFQKLGYGL